MTPEEVAQTLMNTVPSEIPIGVFVQAAELIQGREKVIAEEKPSREALMELFEAAKRYALGDGRRGELWEALVRCEEEAK